MSVLAAGTNTPRNMIPQTTCPSSTNSGVNTTKLLFVTGTKYCHDLRWILRHDRANHLQRSQTQCRLKWQYTFAYRPWRSRKQDSTFSLMPTPSCIVLDLYWHLSKHSINISFVLGPCHKCNFSHFSILHSATSYWISLVKTLQHH